MSQIVSNQESGSDKLLSQWVAQQKLCDAGIKTSCPGYVESTYEQINPIYISAILLALILLAFFGIRKYLALRIVYSRKTKQVVSLCMMWAIGVFLWGQIWRWNSILDWKEYATLYFSIPILIIAGNLCLKWIFKTEKGK